VRRVDSNLRRNGTNDEQAKTASRKRLALDEGSVIRDVDGEFAVRDASVQLDEASGLAAGAIGVFDRVRQRLARCRRNVVDRISLETKRL
jgi:hypothetical protein